MTINKIKRVSYLFRLLFQLFFIAIPITSVCFWFNAPTAFGFPEAGATISFIPQNIKILHPLSTATKCYGFLISLIPLACSQLTLYFLIKLFRRFEQADIFSSKNVVYIRNIGYTILAGQVLNPIYLALISFALTWNNPHSQRGITIGVDQTNIVALLTSLLVILISWIVAEGYKLREEQQYTI